MPSIINSDDGQTSGSAGLKFTSGDDGVLKIQNNGADAMTVSAAGDLQVDTIKTANIKSSTGNTALAISDNGVVTQSLPPIATQFPYFHAYRSADQTVGDRTTTRVSLNVVANDTESWWDATNYRYIPQIPGYYLFTWKIGINGTTIIQYYSYLYKNGGPVSYERALGISGTTTAGIGGVSSLIIYMNGTTDYADIRGWVDAASGQGFAAGVWNTFLQGCLLQRTA
jgi:hypothetical protein